MHKPGDVWQLLPRASEIKTAEKILEQESVLAQKLLPGVQFALTAGLQAEMSRSTREGTGGSFYRADVDYVHGPPFSTPREMTHRSHTVAAQPDAVRAIVDFRSQLAACGIDFIAVPVPVKPTIEAKELSTQAPLNVAVENPSFAEFKMRLAKADVRVFDATPSLMQRKRDLGGAPLYLQTDTHWASRNDGICSAETRGIYRDQENRPTIHLHKL